MNAVFVVLEIMHKPRIEYFKTRSKRQATSRGRSGSQSSRGHLAPYLTRKQTCDVRLAPA